MPISERQMARLHDIRRSVLSLTASPAVWAREVVALHPEWPEEAAKGIDSILASEDGSKAFTAIRLYHEGTVRAIKYLITLCPTP